MISQVSNIVKNLKEITAINFLKAINEEFTKIENEV